MEPPFLGRIPTDIVIPVWSETHLMAWVGRRQGDGKHSGGDWVHSRHGASLTVRSMGGAGLTSVVCPGVSGLMSGRGVRGVGLRGAGFRGATGRVGRAGGMRTDGGGLGRPGAGNTGVIPG